MTDAKDELIQFRNCFYRWALNDFEREINEGFPLLGKVRASATMVDIDALRLIPDLQRRQLIRALLKRFHPEAASDAGEVIMPEELALLRDFDNQRVQMSGLWRYQTVALKRQFASDPKLRHYIPSEAANDPDMDPLIDLKQVKRELPKVVLGGLSEFFGTKPSNFGGREWQFQSSLGRWTVLTDLDFGGDVQMRVDHTIQTGEGKLLRRATCIGDWLGIGSVSWDKVGPSNIPEASETIVQLTQHLLDALRKMEAAIVD